MQTQFHVDSLKVSWTKYDIVHALDIFEDRTTLESYYRGEATFNRPILRAILGLASDDAPIPEFWYEVIDELEGKEKSFFVFFAILFTNYRILREFSHFFTAPFQGTYYLGVGKESTNTRSLLVESGLASPTFRRKEIVPFDGSILLNSSKAGQLFKRYLQTQISIHSENYDPRDFADICKQNNLNACIGLTYDRFINWLEGVGLTPGMCRGLEFEDFLCFRGKNSLYFNESKEIYLIGENGDGKTLILWLLYLVFNGAQMQKRCDPKHIGGALSKLRLCNGLLSGVDDLGQRYTLDSAPLFRNFYAYGPHRGLYASENDDYMERYGFMTLFADDLKLKNPIDWLKNLYLKSQQQEVCHENSFDKISEILSKLLEEKVQVKMEGSDIYFYEKNYRLELPMLSEGYRNVIIMACDLFARLMENNNYDQDIFNTSGVVLIDEICQHLHPRWQREIVSKLRDIFKNMQFIVSTHSPFVIQGASADAIAFRVYRDDGRASISEPYYIDQMKDMMLNTLSTSSMFGVDSAAMEHAENIDTSDSYVVSRINKAVATSIAEMRAHGKNFISADVIDELVRNAMEEDASHDQTR